MTDKTKEALKLALEALENTTPTGFNMERDKQFFDAITALREALAEQPAQQGCMRCNTPKKCALYGCSPLTWPAEQPAIKQDLTPEQPAPKWQGVRFDSALHDQPAQPQQEPSTLFESFQEFGEGWERLAWELCADENGEEACNDLIWEGGPIPEPWGDRWLKYEDEAKRLIALVHKHTSPAQRKPLTDEELRVIENKINPTMRWRSSDEEGITLYPIEYYELVRAIEAKLKEKNA